MALSVIAVGLIVAGSAPEASAHGNRDWGWRGRRFSRQHHHGGRFSFEPVRSISITYIGRHATHDLGTYRVHGRRKPVCGTIVQAIPAEAQTVIVNGTVYHLHDGTYYKGGPAGYTVVEVPVPAGKGAAQGDGDTLVINVPNANGSYTPVTLRSLGHGVYLGPQGEVYPNKPDPQQLAAMYAK
jgi:hypothetical protein